MPVWLGQLGWCVTASGGGALWCKCSQRDPMAEPCPVGRRSFAEEARGDQRSHVIEAHSEAILTILASKDDITLDELQERLASQGVHAGRTTLWRFFKRRKITLKKSRRTRPSKAAPMS